MNPRPASLLSAAAARARRARSRLLSGIVVTATAPAAELMIVRVDCAGRKVARARGTLDDSPG